MQISKVDNNHMSLKWRSLRFQVFRGPGLQERATSFAPLTSSGHTSYPFRLGRRLGYCLSPDQGESSVPPLDRVLGRPSWLTIQVEGGRITFSPSPLPYGVLRGACLAGSDPADQHRDGRVTGLQVPAGQVRTRARHFAAARDGRGCSAFGLSPRTMGASRFGASPKPAYQESPRTRRALSSGHVAVSPYERGSDST